MDFERSSRRNLVLPLTSLIDVVFILIVFFMLTTSFMRIESLELTLPSSGDSSDKKEVVHIFIKENGELFLGRRKVEADELDKTLKRLFAGDASSPVMLLTADGVTMQQLVFVMDRIKASGGKSLFVRKWEEENSSSGSGRQ